MLAPRKGVKAAKGGLFPVGSLASWIFAAMVAGSLDPHQLPETATRRRGSPNFSTIRLAVAFPWMSLPSMIGSGSRAADPLPSTQTPRVVLLRIVLADTSGFDWRWTRSPRIRAWRFETVPDTVLTRTGADPIVKLALLGVTPLHPEMARRDTLLELTYLCPDGHTHTYLGLKSRFRHQAMVSTVLFTAETLLAPNSGALDEDQNRDDFEDSLFGHFLDSGFVPLL